jgi:hypothetical protein
MGDAELSTPEILRRILEDLENREGVPASRSATEPDLTGGPGTTCHSSLSGKSLGPQTAESLADTAQTGPTGSGASLLTRVLAYFRG